MDDQVEVSESTETQETEVNQEAQDVKQSNEETKEQELFELPDGRKVDALTLSKEWKEKFYPEFTRRSQALADFRKREEQLKATSEDEARQAVEENDKFKDVPQEVKELIIETAKPLFEQLKQEEENRLNEKRTQEQFKKELDDLETKYNGKDGLPKFDRNKVLMAMKEPTNRIYDPEAKYISMHREAYNDYLIKQALKQQGGSLNTESTTGDHSQPESKSPSTFAEARRAAMARITS